MYTREQLANKQAFETISRERAMAELKAHGVTNHEDIDDFFRELGDRDSYDAGRVLRWLGY